MAASTIAFVVFITLPLVPALIVSVEKYFIKKLGKGSQEEINTEPSILRIALLFLYLAIWLTAFLTMIFIDEI